MKGEISPYIEEKRVISPQFKIWFSCIQCLSFMRCILFASFLTPKNTKMISGKYTVSNVSNHDIIIKTSVFLLYLNLLSGEVNKKLRRYYVSTYLSKQ